MVIPGATISSVPGPQERQLRSGHTDYTIQPARSGTSRFRTAGVVLVKDPAARRPAGRGTGGTKLRRCGSGPAVFGRSYRRAAELRDWFPYYRKRRLAAAGMGEALNAVKGAAQGRCTSTTCSRSPCTTSPPQRRRQRARCSAIYANAGNGGTARETLNYIGEQFGPTPASCSTAASATPSSSSPTVSPSIATSRFPRTRETYVSARPYQSIPPAAWRTWLVVLHQQPAARPPTGLLNVDPSDTSPAADKNPIYMNTFGVSAGPPAHLRHRKHGGHQPMPELPGQPATEPPPINRRSVAPPSTAAASVSPTTLRT
jgi:hypothetical protein